MDKHYYQILLKRKKNINDLLFWIRNEKIDVKNDIELQFFIKKNCEFVKSYDDVNSIVAFEIEEEKYKEFLSSYKNPKKYDFFISDDTE